VHIGGEVVYPGWYPISKNGSRLSTLVTVAGGFTEFASIKNAELTRRSVAPYDIDLERLESLRGGVPPEDSSYYYLETNLRIQKEIVNVDFARLFIAHDTTVDVFLQDDDNVFVPSAHATIYVFGQVVSSGHIPYVPGETVDYYVQKAGGYTDRARTGDVRIVKAKSRQWLFPSDTKIEEGDYVWVPKVADRPFGYYLAIVGQTASIVGVALSVVLIAIQLTK
jgi:protein involved in polysaccharide export with SLBB domain